jgi:hypothetical protein
MPARAARLYLVPGEHAAPGRVVRFPVWWDAGEVFERFRSRAIDTGSPFREESGILLTVGEAIALDERARAAFVGDPRRVALEREMADLAAALPALAWVVVESFEWESGLD